MLSDSVNGIISSAKGIITNSGVIWRTEHTLGQNEAFFRTRYILIRTIPGRIADKVLAINPRAKELFVQLILFK